MSESVQKDIAFVKSLLPEHYVVQESSKKYSIHCRSSIGLRTLSGDNDNERFDEFFKRIKEYFKDRFLEVNHITCAYHQNFTIYLKAWISQEESLSTQKQQHMDTKYGPSGRVAPSRNIDWEAEQRRQKDFGRSLDSSLKDYPRTPNECFQSAQVGITTGPSGKVASSQDLDPMPGVYMTDTPRIVSDSIKPFLMIDINAVKNKHYSIQEIIQMLEHNGISIRDYYSTANLDFGRVLLALKEGKKLARAGWNGKGMFIYYVPANIYPSVTIVAQREFGVNTKYNEYIAIKNVDDTVSTWVPSINDCFANDWMIV